MAKFRHSFCGPFSSEIEELGDIEETELVNKFNKVPWNEILHKMSTMAEDELHYSPSIEFENKTNRHGITISGIEEDRQVEFYFFYKRPKRIKKFFGFIEKEDPNYMTDILVQSKQEVIRLIEAFIRDDYELLDTEIRR